MWLSYLLYFILAGVERFMFNTMISHILFVIPLVFIITLNYESSLLKRLAVTISNYVVFSIAVIFVYIPAYHLAYEHVYILEYSLGSLLSLFIALHLNRFKTIRKNDNSSPLFWVLALAMPSTVIIVLVVDNMGFHNVSSLLSFVFLMGANLLIFFVYESLSVAHENKRKQALYIQEKESYFTQCQLMQESVESIKSIRHDMKLHLATALDFTANNKADEATNYLKGLLGNIEKNEIYSNTKNIAFDSIINFKLNSAKQDKIKLDIRLLVPPSLNIEVADIVTIIGNLLDNALDAVSKVEEKIIKLDIEYSRESLFIQVENSFDGIVKYEKEADEGKKRIITRKGGSEHGHGLKNIRKSVEKYNGHIDINHDDSVFSVGVLLYVD